MITIDPSIQPQDLYVNDSESIENMRATAEYQLKKSPTNTNNHNKPFVNDYPEYQITPCETEITQHYDMDEHKNNALPQSSQRNINHSSRYRKPQAHQEDAVATNLGQKYLSIVKKQPYNNNIIAQLDTKRSYHVNNVSVCLTEEIPHQSTINPVNLADKDWTDPYKLTKLLTQQKKNHYMANQIFGNQCTCNNLLAPTSSVLNSF